MNRVRRVISVWLAFVSLLIFPASARMITSAWAALTPASPLLAEPLTCWVHSQMGGGQYRYSFDVWKDGRLMAPGPQETSSAAYSFTPVVPGKYQVRVVVEDLAYGGEITIQSPSVQVALRTAPKVTVETVSGKALRITWDAVAGAAGYEIWRALSKTGPYQQIRYVAGTSLTHTYLAAGTRYFYKVRSVHMAGGVKVISSGFNAPASGVPLGRAAIVSVRPARTGAVTLAWDAVPGATRYEVCVSALAGGAYGSPRTTPALSLTLTNLAPGATRYFKVRAYRRIGTVNYYGAWSGYRSAKVPK